MHFTKPKNVENFHEKIKNKIPIFCKRIESKCGTGSFNVTTMCKAWALEVFVCKLLLLMIFIIRIYSTVSIHGLAFTLNWAPSTHNLGTLKCSPTFADTSFDFDNIYTEEQLERMVHLGEK